MNKMVLNIFMFLVFEDICGFLLSSQEWPLDKIVLSPSCHFSVFVYRITVYFSTLGIDQNPTKPFSLSLLKQTLQSTTDGSSPFFSIPA